MFFFTAQRKQRYLPVKNDFHESRVLVQKILETKEKAQLGF
jgi:hypothetical protein